MHTHTQTHCTWTELSYWHIDTDVPHIRLYHNCPCSFTCSRCTVVGEGRRQIPVSTDKSLTTVPACFLFWDYTYSIFHNWVFTICYNRCKHMQNLQIMTIIHLLYSERCRRLLAQFVAVICSRRGREGWVRKGANAGEALCSTRAWPFIWSRANGCWCGAWFSCRDGCQD